MTKDEMMTAVNSALEEAAASRQKAVDIAKAHMGKYLQVFLEETPEIGAFGWSQFTPYFNDGEECIFRLNDVYFLPKNKVKESLEFHDVYDGEDSFYVSEYRLQKGELGDTGVSLETYRACKKLKDMLNEQEEIMKDVFGDHVYVLVTVDGVTVEEYEHD
jgi:hypothetical protein